MLFRSRIRLESYEACCWPRFARVAFRHQPLLTTLVLAVGFAAILLVARSEPPGSTPDGDFYRVIPHHVMVALFGAVSALALVALAVGCRRFWRDVRAAAASVSFAREASRQRLSGSVLVEALRDVLTLRHLHGGGVDCAAAPEARTPWRRWFHHATFYGFALCFASTSVAALYHLLGWRAPYAYTSLPVLLGTLGGAGLLIGPVGLLTIRAMRDASLVDSEQEALDSSLAILLLLTSVTGLLLLVWRSRPAMATLLIVHLSLVLALFLSLPYGKFVHGIYRGAALVRFGIEERRLRPRRR